MCGMLDHRSNAFVEAMSGQLQQAKRDARGYRAASNFITIAYLQMSRIRACRIVRSGQRRLLNKAVAFHTKRLGAAQPQTASGSMQVQANRRVRPEHESKHRCGLPCR